MRLFIAEKPSLGQALAQGIGSGKKESGYISLNGGNDIVTWCFGHILEQLNPDEYDEKYKRWRMEDLPILPEKWKLKVRPDAAKQFKVVKELAIKADTIVNAGDPDREGQLLVDEVLEYIGNKKPVQRILLNALDEKSVKEALRDLRDNRDFQGLKNSALGRSRADWLVGMNLSRAYSIRAQQAGYDGSISVGRVMTPTMALVVRREEEIKNFHPVKYFTVEALLHHEMGNIPAVWQIPEDTEGVDSEGRLVERSVADTFLRKLQDAPKGTRGKILSVEEKKQQEGQRLPYSLSALQIEAGKRYGYSPQTVLDTMQSLYEKKLTTYPRSDCDYLPENQFDEAGQVLASVQAIPREDISRMVEQADTSIRSRAWNDKKISAHHAIIPTRIAPDFGTLSDCEQNLYCMVAQAYLAQFFPVHTYLSTVIRMEYMGEQFAGKGRTVTEIGWKAVYGKQSLEETEKEPEPTLPVVSEGDEVEYLEGRISEKTTKAPSRFTPATLLKAMKEIHKYVLDVNLRAELKECSGIGTEATRAGIIEKLQASGFLTLSKKYLLPTDKANLAVKILPKSLTYPDTTAVWEKELEDVARGTLTLDDFSRKQEEPLSGLLEQAKTVTITASPKAVLCPKCGKPMRRRKGKNGFFWGCTGYPGCSATAPDNHGKPDFSGKGRTRKK
ncbi:MAG: DNA topoisomerase III [Selenomonadaceae bacterium]|nr:DNA topoisomerase III [Selenomonadaceae bacterium]